MSYSFSLKIVGGGNLIHVHSVGKLKSLMGQAKKFSISDMQVTSQCTLAEIGYVSHINGSE